MGRDLTNDELIKHRDIALNKLSNYITDLINSDDKHIKSKSDKLSYWIEDWTKFLEFENQFNPSSLRRYKRGEVIKAHLGYNIGSEEGGLHYCIVLDKNNSKNSPVLTVVPLTSVKNKTDLEHLYPGNIYLGNELFTNLNSKITHTEKTIKTRLDEIVTAIEKDTVEITSDISRLQQLVKDCKRDLKLLEKLKKEVSKMKIGSIALVNQITTISKIRIYDPKTNFDILSNVKFSNEKLDLLDTELLKLFTKG